MAIRDPGDRTLGVMAYVFLANRKPTKNRPQDEHRTQIRYGKVNDSRWRALRHSIGFDPTSVDITIVLAVHPVADLVIALDPILYDPLPLGISIFFKDAEINHAVDTGWHVWERDNISGERRRSPRAQLGVETIIAFAPERLFDFLSFERQASALRLDPPLRFRAAERAAKPSVDISEIHELEKEFALPGDEILGLIKERARLAMAVRGGVAEHHMGRVLGTDHDVARAVVGHREGPPDFFVVMSDGSEVTVEVKNASPRTYADGTPKVEVQKTRASQGDPASRYYSPSAFDVIAACMYGPTGKWRFRYKRSKYLTKHSDHGGRIAPLQRVDDSWANTLGEALKA
jgi:hypothetical protein